jgi:hypothetical protein
MKAKVVVVTFAVSVLLTLCAGAAISAVSVAGTVDTRSQSRMAALEDDTLDTRGYTVDWSMAAKVDTHVPLGTMMMLK